MKIVLTHGYFIHEDPAEAAVMKPYPPLGLLYVAAYLKAQGLDVEVLDTTFLTRDELDGSMNRSWKSTCCVDVTVDQLLPPFVDRFRSTPRTNAVFGSVGETRICPKYQPKLEYGLPSPEFVVADQLAPPSTDL